LQEETFGAEAIQAAVAGKTARLHGSGPDHAGILFANLKRTFDEYQGESLEGIRQNRRYVEKVLSDAQAHDNRTRQIQEQALQNAVETANMVGKQAVRHGDVAIDNGIGEASRAGNGTGAKDPGDHTRSKADGSSRKVCPCRDGAPARNAGSRARFDRSAALHRLNHACPAGPRGNRNRGFQDSTADQSTAAVEERRTERRRFDSGVEQALNPSRLSSAVVLSVGTR
jgi:hypothetical protein